VELPIILEPDPPGPGVLVAGYPEAPAYVDVTIRLVPARLLLPSNPVRRHGRQGEFTVDPALLAGHPVVDDARELPVTEQGDRVTQRA
jgi:hypothetical protein